MSTINCKFLISDDANKLQIFAQKPERVTCTNRRSRCFLKSITCPIQCPLRRPKDPKAKACYINCDSPICKAECRRKPKAELQRDRAACYDPPFIGADGGVLYFHGKKNEHFTLVSDSNLQINASFIGQSPTGRTRDYTWIQALGILFGSHNSAEATKAATWNNNVDHFRFSLDGNEVVLPRLRGNLKTATLSFLIFRVAWGVLTYRPDYERRLRSGVAMAVVGGEDEYRTTTLFAANCKKCVFSAIKDGDERLSLEIM
ncbi:hypothetical protein DH2020_008562 [Rehmannia glutinosa]|uniref:Uncharacterized protein n=1 Tax=Rehmannia glutinosa TaxID=99300 RepID=A0ABR0X4F5_REHGL